MIKKLFALLAVFAAAVLIFGGCGNRNEYYYLEFIPNGDETEWAVALRETYPVDIAEIPAYYGGKPVTAIADEGFARDYGLLSIKLPDSIKTIGRDAFVDCNNLENVYYEGSLESWLNIDFASPLSNPLQSGENAHEEDGFKTALYIGEDKLEILVIPQHIARIKPYCFYGCGSITEVNIPDGIPQIGEQAFWGCGFMKNAIIGNSITELPFGAFGKCQNLEEVTLSDNIKAIGEECFRSTALKGIDLPQGLEEIGKQAFLYSGLEEINFPDSLTKIGAGAFAFCKLAEVNTGRVVTVGDAAFQSNPIKKAVFGEYLDRLGEGAFYNCNDKDFNSVVLPASLKHLGKQAFYRCNYLNSVTFEYPHFWVLEDEPEVFLDLQDAERNADNLKYDWYNKTLVAAGA